MFWLGLIELLLKSYPLCANISVRCVRPLRKQVDYSLYGLSRPGCV